MGAVETDPFETAEYLSSITEFSRLLRLEGLPVGLGETADACRVLEDVPLENRELVRAALRAVFAKSQEEQAVFDRCFAGFFVSREARAQRLEKARAEQEELARQRAKADEELRYRGKPLDLRDDLRDVYTRMPESERERLRQVMEKYKSNIDRNPELYGNFIHSVFTRALLEQQMAMEDAAVGVEHFDDPDMELLYREISQFKDAEIPRAAALIARITQQLNGELSAKRRRGGRSGPLDFRKTIRRGLETGGSFYRLSYKKRRRRRQKLVLLLDVSGSMLQFSEFTLQFIRSMADVSESSRTFLFSEHLHEVDAFALQSAQSFRSCVKESGLYGRGTDLGAALEELLAEKPAVLGPSTTLLILSDTKTVNIARAELALGAAAREAGRILWLNPIPERKWPYIRSVQTIAARCRMVPCSTLEELSRACRRLVRT
jgi:uncharacterized protein with von Willebrand factor type A (vWA) domain